MTKHTIKVELPNGWKAVAFRKPVFGENYWDGVNIHICLTKYKLPHLIIEKIQEAEVKEIAIPLNYAEPKLSLSVADAKELLNYLPSNTDFYKELVEFIGGKS